MDDTTCSMCAETIKRAALICPHCRSPQYANRHAERSLSDVLSIKQRILIVSALAITIFIWSAWRPISDMFKPDPVPVTVAKLEAEFDADPVSALARWSGRPILLTGKIAGTDDGDLLLETIYFAPVRAHIDRNPLGMVGSPVLLHCRDVRIGGMFDDKPEPLDCNVVEG